MKYKKKFKRRSLKPLKPHQMCKHGDVRQLSENELNILNEKLRINSEILKEKHGHSFYTTEAWLRVRYQTLIRDGKRCAICQSRLGPFHVDHIKPRSKYPELALEANNLRVLCRDCNLGKSDLEIE